MIYPPRLKKGDEIRVISPSSSIERIGGMEANLSSKTYLEKLGFVVTFGKNILQSDIQNSSSIQNRIDDLHDAFLDKSVKIVLTTIGGFNSIEMLPYIDFELIKNNPKIFCGYSDITALNNSIFSKTGLVTYSGPGYSAFKMKDLQEYQTKMWLEALQNDSYTLEKSQYYSSDLWFLENIERKLHTNEWKIYNSGIAEGIIIGANLSTFCLLQGTEYLPKVDNPILFIESSEEDTSFDFTRRLASILLAVPNLKALLIGRFPKEVNMTEELFLYILNKHPILKKIPVMYDMNFGHTQPIFTFPIGAKANVNTVEKTIKIIK